MNTATSSFHVGDRVRCSRYEFHALRHYNCDEFVIESISIMENGSYTYNISIPGLLWIYELEGNELQLVSND